MEVKVQIDLTPMRTMFWRLDPLLPLEEVIVENFNTLNTLEYSTLDKVIQHAINIKFNTVDKVYKFNSLGTLYNTSKFIHTAKTFIDTLTSILNRNFDPYYNKIVFDSIIEKSESKYIVLFKGEYI